MPGAFASILFSPHPISRFFLFPASISLSLSARIVNGLPFDSGNLKTRKNFRRQMKGERKEEDKRTVRRKSEREQEGGTYVVT